MILIILKTGSWVETKDKSVLQALDISLLSFARWAEADNDPSWIINGTKAYKSDGTSYRLSAPYVARLGYNTALKICMSGLCLMSEISVSCFLQGGRLIDVMAAVGNFHDINDMVRSCDPTEGLSRQLIRKLEELLKNARIRTIHLGHTKKIKGFGEFSKLQIFEPTH
jgi:hypothetical protein